MVERRGGRPLRSEKKSVVLEGRVAFGVKVSPWIVATSPRWVGVETSSLKASWSSCETVIPDCMMTYLDVAVVLASQTVESSVKTSLGIESALDPTSSPHGARHASPLRVY